MKNRLYIDSKDKAGNGTFLCLSHLKHIQSFAMPGLITKLIADHTTDNFFITTFLTSQKRLHNPFNVNTAILKIKAVANNSRFAKSISNFFFFVFQMILLHYLMTSFI